MVVTLTLMALEVACFLSPLAPSPLSLPIKSGRARTSLPPQARPLSLSLSSLSSSRRVARPARPSLSPCSRRALSSTRGTSPELRPCLHAVRHSSFAPPRPHPALPGRLHPAVRTPRRSYVVRHRVVPNHPTGAPPNAKTSSSLAVPHLTATESLCSSLG
jgi:hypothetical protein